MAELGIVVEADLGVEHEQLALVRDRQRVDLDLRSVGAEERVIELGEHLARLLGEVAAEPERRGDCAAVVRHQSRRRIDGDRRDLLRRVVRDLLDLHSAFGRGDDRNPPALAVDEQREVEFLVDVDSVGDVEPLDLLAVRAGLDRDQSLAEHLGGMLAHLVDRMGEADAALGAVAELLELALAAAAGVDLRLHDPKRPGQLLRRLDRFLDAHRRIARGDRNADISRAALWPDIRGCSWARPLIRTPPRCKATTRARCRKIIHVDMDAFYASVEQRDDPS